MKRLKKTIQNMPLRQAFTAMVAAAIIIVLFFPMLIIIVGVMFQHWLLSETDSLFMNFSITYSNHMQQDFSV